MNSNKASAPQHSVGPSYLNLPSSSPAQGNALAVEEDIELDDGLSDSFTLKTGSAGEEYGNLNNRSSAMSFRGQKPHEDSSTPKFGEVANAIASCGALSFFSISMILANKALAYTFQAELRVLPMAFQCLTAVILVETSRRLGWVKYEPFNMATAMRWFPIVLFFCFMLISSFMSYKYMNVPMVTVFKSLTNLIIVTGDYFWHGQGVSFLILASLVVMTGGATLASWSDLSFNVYGYFWMTANCFGTAGYVLTMKFATRTMKLPKFGMVFYNNLLGMCVMLPLAILMGEVWTLRDSQVGFLDRGDLHSPSYLWLNLFAGAAGFFLNFAALWCVGATSATTYAVVNTVNNFPVSIIGYFVFHDNISITQAEFIVVNIFGGFLYSAGKLREQKERERKEAELNALAGNDNIEAVPLVSAGDSSDTTDKRASPSRRM